MRWWSLACLQILGACGFEVSILSEDAAAQRTCSYTVTLAGSTSKYLLAGDQLAWRLAEASCESQQAHLFVPSSDAEVMAMRSLAGDNKHWVGIAQQPGQVTPAAGWLLVTGGPHTSMWSSGRPDDGGSEDGSEQAGSLDKNGLDDDNHRDSKPYICECDGVAADASITAVLPL